MMATEECKGIQGLWSCSVPTRKKYSEFDDFFCHGDLITAQCKSLLKYYRIEEEPFEKYGQNGTEDSTVFCIGDVVFCRVPGCGMRFESVSQVGEIKRYQKYY